MRLKRMCVAIAELARVGYERDTLRKIVDISQRILGVESSRLALVDKRDEELFCVAVAPARRVPRRAVTLRLESLPGARTAIKSRRSVVVRPEIIGRGQRPVRRARGTPRAVAYLPLVSKSRAFGLLSLVARRGRDFSKQDLELAGHLTSYASVAIENSRLLTQLSETEERFRSLVEHIPAIVYASEVEPPYRTLYVSPQVEQMLGYSPEEWLSHPGLFMNVVHPEDAKQVVNLSAEAVRRKGFSMGEYRVIDRDGGVHWLRDEAVLISDPTGKPVAWHGVLIDITGSKTLEERNRYMVTVGHGERGSRPSPDA